MKRTSPLDVLLIDCGNSRIGWSHYDGDAITAPKSGLHGGTLPRKITAQWPQQPARQVLIANVAGVGLQQQLESWFASHWDITPTFLQAQRQAHGVTNGYPQAESLGVDRWLALIGARSVASQPLCVVDCGTAVTIDLLDAGGVHHGGVITPGYGMMLTCLQQGTAIAGITSHGYSGQLLGSSTAECIGSGAVNTIAALIDRVMRAKPGHALLMTGGDAQRICPLLEHHADVIPDLLFRGMARYATQPLARCDGNR
jgi:type III pantothenate kinase